MSRQFRMRIRTTSAPDDAPDESATKGEMGAQEPDDRHRTDRERPERQSRESPAEKKCDTVDGRGREPEAQDRPSNKKCDRRRGEKQEERNR